MNTEDTIHDVRACFVCSGSFGLLLTASKESLGLDVQSGISTEAVQAILSSGGQSLDSRFLEQCRSGGGSAHRHTGSTLKGTCGKRKGRIRVLQLGTTFLVVTS